MMEEKPGVGCGALFWVSLCAFVVLMFMFYILLRG